MNIIITGALGHIGSRLLDDLPKLIKIKKILIIDNLLTQRYSSLFYLKNSNYEFIEADLSNKDSLIQLEKIKEKYDCLIHLAAMTNAESSLLMKKKFINNNYNATKNVVSYCDKKNIPLIYASSTSVYGTQKKVIDENCTNDNLKPQSPYAESKLKEEKLILSKINKSSLKATIFRFGTISGLSKGMRFHTAINKFCYQSSMNLPITVWKTALNQKRPYLDLIDLVNVIGFFLNNKIFEGKVYNVVTKNLTVNDIIKIIKKYSKNVKLLKVNSKIMNQLSYEVKNSNLDKLNFKFLGNIEKSIRETINLFKNINSK